MTGFLRSMRAGAGTVRELMHFCWKRKIWWMLPMGLILLLTVILLLIAQASGTAPFVYPPF